MAEKTPKEGDAGWLILEWCKVRKNWSVIAAFNMQEGTVSQAILMASRKRTDLSQESPEEVQPCRHIDFSPVEPIFDSWPSELKFAAAAIKY